jgi:hypothetical protein
MRVLDPEIEPFDAIRIDADPPRRMHVGQPGRAAVAPAVTDARIEATDAFASRVA